MKKMHILLVCLGTGLLISFQPVNSQDNNIFQSEKLVKKWETPPDFNVPESVCYDAAGNVLYVSNISGQPTGKDGNGYISKLGLDGTIIKKIWATGMSAPKGMGVYDGKLYVSDIDRVIEIDLVTAKTTQVYKFPGVKFLNDIAIDARGAVYVSDMSSTRIFKISGGKSETWLDDTTLTSPNGLFAESGYLVIGCKKIVKVGYTTKKITEWHTGTGGIDGLEAIGNGQYLFSDWEGRIYLVGPDKQIEKILDTTPAGINAADIEFIPAKKLLLVPTFGDNRVMAYELK